MQFLVLLSLVCLASTVSGQAAGACTQTDMDLGLYLKSHEMYCNLYYHCLPDLSAKVRTCPEGLLFDDASKICQRPERATCLNKQCSSFADNTMWAHSCCDRYMGCRSGKFYFGKCDSNSMFDSQRGQCVNSFGSTTCEDTALCPRRYIDNTVQTPCMLRAVPNEPCKFQTFDRDGNDLGIQHCAEGTSFNTSSCNCGNLYSNCSKNTATAIDNRYMDPQCRATMILDFASEVPISYTMKTPNGQRMMNSYAIGAQGYTATNSEGIFRTDADGNKPRLYFWTYARNMLLGPFGIKISFRVDNPQEGYSFALISNDMSAVRQDCAGTLDIRATYQNRGWVIAFNAIGYNSMNGQMTTVRETQNVPGGNGYITVSFMMSRDTKTMSGYVRGQGANPVSWGPVNLGGDQIAINSCGLAVADGLEGRLNEVKFFEACGDENILRSNMQNP